MDSLWIPDRPLGPGLFCHRIFSRLNIIEIIVPGRRSLNQSHFWLPVRKSTAHPAAVLVTVIRSWVWTSACRFVTGFTASFFHITNPHTSAVAKLMYNNSLLTSIPILNHIPKNVIMSSLINKCNTVYDQMSYWGGPISPLVFYAWVTSNLGVFLLPWIRKYSLIFSLWDSELKNI